MRVPIRKPGKYTHQKSDLHITAKKLKEFKDELKKIKNIARPHAMLEVKRLSELGDFSENAEYQIAKGRLRRLNYRIDELEDAIKKAKIITTGGKSKTIIIGSFVTIEQDDQVKKYLVLGSAESDPLKGIISHTSPIGSALIGKRVGDIFSVKLASRDLKCRVINIE